MKSFVFLLVLIVGFNVRADQISALAPNSNIGFCKSIVPLKSSYERMAEREKQLIDQGAPETAIARVRKIKDMFLDTLMQMGSYEAAVASMVVLGPKTYNLARTRMQTSAGTIPLVIVRSSFGNTSGDLLTIPTPGLSTLQVTFTTMGLCPYLSSAGDLPTHDELVTAANKSLADLLN